MVLELFDSSQRRMTNSDLCCYRYVLPWKEIVLFFFVKVFYKNYGEKFHRHSNFKCHSHAICTYRAMWYRVFSCTVVKFCKRVVVFIQRYVLSTPLSKFPSSLGHPVFSFIFVKFVAIFMRMFDRQDVFIRYDNFRQAMILVSYFIGEYTFTTRLPSWLYAAVSLSTCKTIKPVVTAVIR